MREILFRGKTEQGEWVYGDLLQLHKKAPYWYILPNGVSSELYEDEPYPFRQNDVMCRVALSKVIPETVGQYIGLDDVNSKKIFDGDIVSFEEELYIVRQECERMGGFWMDTGYVLDKIGWNYCVSFEDTYGEFSGLLEVIVVGNLHDNPELLEGKGNDTND